MILDLILIGGAVISIGVGYAKGFISSLLSLIGYFGGAIAALYGAMRLTQTWKGTSVILVYLLAILLGASIGREVLSRIGRGIHKKFLPRSLRILNGVLGSILSATEYTLACFVFCFFAQYFLNSYFSQYLNQSFLLLHIINFYKNFFQISALVRL